MISKNVPWNANVRAPIQASPPSIPNKMASCNTWTDRRIRKSDKHKNCLKTSSAAAFSYTAVDGLSSRDCAWLDLHFQSQRKSKKSPRLRNIPKYCVPPGERSMGNTSLKPWSAQSWCIFSWMNLCSYKASCLPMFPMVMTPAKKIQGSQERMYRKSGDVYWNNPW